MAACVGRSVGTQYIELYIDLIKHPVSLVSIIIYYFYYLVLLTSPKGRSLHFISQYLERDIECGLRILVSYVETEPITYQCWYLNYSDTHVDIGEGHGLQSDTLCA